MNQTANSTQVDSGALWRSLDLPWTQWKEDSLNTFADVALWLSRYTQYIGQAQAYLNDNPNATLPAVSADYNPTSVDLSSVSYGDLVTEYKGAYQGFIEWYNLFFGVDGLVAVSQREVMDGSVPVYEFSGNITSFEEGEGAATFAVDRPFDLPTQLESIAEWISTKFGGVILTNSCNLCNSQQPPVVTPPMNGTDSNSTEGNSTDGNSTIGNQTEGNNGTDVNGTDVNGTDVNGTDVNGTTPIDNGTMPEDNSTLPVDNSTMPEVNTTVPEVPVVDTPVVDTPVVQQPVETTPGPQP